MSSRTGVDLLLLVAVGLLISYYAGSLKLTPAEKIYVDLHRRGIEFPVTTMAQVIHETGWLTTKLSRECFNWWGLKPSSKKEISTWTIHACFESPEEAWDRYISFQKKRMGDYRKYRGEIRTREDYHKFLECLVIPRYGVDKCFRYAEDPNYIKKISRLENVLDAQISTIKTEIWIFYYSFHGR